MKHLLSLLFFCAMFPFSSSAQEKESQFKQQFIYAMTFQMDSLDSKKQTETMELLTNGSHSVFQSLEKGFRDSVNLMNRKEKADYDVRNDASFRGKLKPINSLYSIFRTDNQFRVLDAFSLGMRSDNYQYYEEEIVLDWKLTGKQDSLLGLPVQQATTEFGGRTWEAWFTPEIPIGAGPYKFHGLPGLIVKIKDSQDFWTFTLTDMKQDINRQVALPTGLPKTVAKTDKLAFFKGRNDYFLNRTIIDEAAGNIIVGTPEGRQQSIDWDKKYAKSQNNWIEKFQ